MNGDTKLTPDSAVVCTFHIVNSTLNTAYIEIVMNDRSFPCFVLSTSTSIRTTVRLGMRKVKKDWKPGGRSRRHVLTGRRNCRNWRTYSYTSSLRTKAIALQSRLVFQQPRSYETQGCCCCIHRGWSASLAPPSMMTSIISSLNIPAASRTFLGA